MQTKGKSKEKRKQQKNNLNSKRYNKEKDDSGTKGATTEC